MRILQILAGKIWGGAEQYVLDLSLHLEKVGHDITYVARNSSVVKKRLECEGVAFHEIRLLSLLDIQSVAKLVPLLRENDVVHIHDVRFVPIVVFAKQIGRCSTRIVLTRHIARASRTMPWNRHWFRGLHNVIFVSRLSMDMWHNANKWFPFDRCSVIMNSIPAEHNVGISHDLRRQYGIAPETPLLMFTGRVRKSKGCEIIVKALGALCEQQFAMFFVGACKPKNYAEKLKRMAEELGVSDKVHFLGFMPDVRQLIKEADIGLAPSIVREACPLSPMEFMQAGKCVVSTNNGAQSEYIVNGKTGVLIPPGNHIALAKQLDNLLNDNEKVQRIGHEAKMHFIQNMNYSLFVEKIINAYL